MVKKLLLIMAFTFALTMAGPIGEARAAVNTVSVQTEAQSVLYGPYLANTPSSVDRLLPAGLWGWTLCIAAVTAWIGTNALLAAKVVSLIKKAGSIKNAISKIKTQADRMNPTKRRAYIIGSFVYVGVNILGFDAVIDKCFSS